MQVNHTLTQMRMDNERLQAEIGRLLSACKEKTALLQDAYAKVERLTKDNELLRAYLGEHGLGWVSQHVTDRAEIERLQTIIKEWPHGRKA